MKNKNHRKKNRYQSNQITAVVANFKGEIFELDGYAAVGMAGLSAVVLDTDNTSDMPFGGELMMLPDRDVVVYNQSSNLFETLYENPYEEGERIFPVAAFNSPGYVNTFLCAYEENEKTDMLPLFSYGALGWDKGVFKTCVIQVDVEKRQDLRLMKQEDVLEGAVKKKKEMPHNRLRVHLEKCALEYGCPAAKNFFIGRFEAPLPTATQCNARCLGCLSLQKKGKISHCQDRISFTPTPDEICEIAICHIGRVKHAIVSFGQGCEGDPLMAAEVIILAIEKIRKITTKGTINVNTNASKPDVLEKMFDAGLDSIRVSLNSVQERCYNAYFRPQGYKFDDVLTSIDLGIKKGKHVSLNYLNCPGFTDSSGEVEAFMKFLTRYRINFIQWRNLNYDPKSYFKEMEKAAFFGEPVGMVDLFNKIKKTFPEVAFGYFNPAKENFK